MERLGFYVCVEDMEDELIRAIGAARVEALIDSQGDLGSFRSLRRQPEWRSRPAGAQLRRFLGRGARRKLRYARLLAGAVDLDLQLICWLLRRVPAARLLDDRVADLHWPCLVGAGNADCARAGRGECAKPVLTAGGDLNPGADCNAGHLLGRAAPGCWHVPAPVCVTIAHPSYPHSWPGQVDLEGVGRRAGVARQVAAGGGERDVAATAGRCGVGIACARIDRAVVGPVPGDSHRRGIPAVRPR
jgi:hypothetical protein